MPLSPAITLHTFFCWRIFFRVLRFEPARQHILETTAILLGEGRVRQVFLAEYEGQPVAVKLLQRQEDIRLHRIELATLDAVSNLSKIMPD